MQLNRILTFVTFGVLLVASVAIVSLNSTTPEALTSVTIGFVDSIDRDFLAQVGAEVFYYFKTFEAVNAFVPFSTIGRILDFDFIEFVAISQPVFAMEDSLQWGVDRVDADLAWGGPDGATSVNGGQAGAGVNLAVIDSGIDYNHPDLSANYKGGYDFVDNDNDPRDGNGHGTHVAGVIAAADNDIGIIGVAPEVNLYAVRVLDNRGSGSSAGVAAGIDWAAANGMDIATLSLGANGNMPEVEAAGIAAYASGLLLFAASGNDGANADGHYPSAQAEFIAVGSTTSSDARSSFSNYGSTLELTAPGSAIYSTTPTYKIKGQFAPAKNYDTMSGTSMATPHAAAVGALAIAANPSMTNVEIRALLQSTAEDLGSNGWDQEFGYGLVDAEAAVGGSSGGGDPSDTTPPTQVTGLSASESGSSSIDLAWSAASDDSGSVSYNVYRDGSLVGTTSATSYSDTGLSGATTYTYQVSAEDASGNEGSASSPVSATTNDPAAGGETGMYVLEISFSEKRKGRNYETTATITVLDENGNAVVGVSVTVSLTLSDGSSGGSLTATTDDNGQLKVKWQSNPCGTYTLMIDGLSLSGYYWMAAGLSGAAFTNC